MHTKCLEIFLPHKHLVLATAVAVFVIKYIIVFTIYY